MKGHPLQARFLSLFFFALASLGASLPARADDAPDFVERDCPDFSEFLPAVFGGSSKVSTSVGEVRGFDRGTNLDGQTVLSMTPWYFGRHFVGTNLHQKGCEAISSSNGVVFRIKRYDAASIELELAPNLPTVELYAKVVNSKSGRVLQATQFISRLGRPRCSAQTGGRDRVLLSLQLEHRLKTKAAGNSDTASGSMPLVLIDLLNSLTSPGFSLNQDSSCASIHDGVIKPTDSSCPGGGSCSSLLPDVEEDRNVSPANWQRSGRRAGKAE